MSDLKYLERSVTELLSGNACVVIPDMGAFLLRQSPASANPFSGEIRPAGQTLFFNPAITADDGLLTSRWREHFGTDYAGAAAMISDCHRQIIEQIRENRNYQLGRLGNFFLNAENKLLFLPFAGVNLDKKAFGLYPVTLTGSANQQTINRDPEIQIRTEPHLFTENATSPEAPVEEAEVLGMEVVEIQNRRGILWKVAATLCLVSLTAVAVYCGKNMLRARRDVQSAAATQAPVQPPSEDHTAKESPSVVYQTVEKDINELNALLKTVQGDVFICGGTYMDRALAINECKTWNKLGVAAVVGRKKGSSLVKVVLGRFNSDEEASARLEKLPANTGFHAGVLIAPITIEE